MAIAVQRNRLPQANMLMGAFFFVLSIMYLSSCAKPSPPQGRMNIRPALVVQESGSVYSAMQVALFIEERQALDELVVIKGSHDQRPLTLELSPKDLSITNVGTGAWLNHPEILLPGSEYFGPWTFELRYTADRVQVLQANLGRIPSLNPGEKPLFAFDGENLRIETEHSGELYLLWDDDGSNDGRPTVQLAPGQKLVREAPPPNGGGFSVMEIDQNRGYPVLWKGYTLSTQPNPEFSQTSAERSP